MTSFNHRTCFIHGNDMQKKKIASIVFVLLMLTVVISNYTPFAEVYGKHKSDNNGSNNNLLPTKGTQRAAINEYTDMPVGSPLFISSHSQHKSEVFGSTSLDLNGEVKNNGTETAKFVKVIATFYNINNVVLGSDFTYTNPDTIEAGQSASYTINVGLGGSVPIEGIDHIKYHIDRQ
jgi:hypothetical protein